MSKDTYYDLAIKMMDTNAYVDEKGVLRNVYFGQSPSEEEIKLIQQNNDDDAVVMNITDNGRFGDGLWLSFSTVVRKRDENANDLFAVKLTLSQAKVLVEAINSVLTLRQAEDK